MATAKTLPVQIELSEAQWTSCLFETRTEQLA